MTIQINQNGFEKKKTESAPEKKKDHPEEMRVGVKVTLGMRFG